MDNHSREIEIREDLLYYVWSLKCFDLNSLTTQDGQQIQILNVGYRNHDSGPDFLEAKLRIGNKTWVGNIEMHVLASDWQKHGHEDDPAFQNVILHVVYVADITIQLPNGEHLSCLEMRDRISPSITGQHHTWMKAVTWIPCQDNERSIESPIMVAWYERLLVERLSQKTERIKTVLEVTKNDWEETFYRQLGRNFGFKKNSEAFEMLTASLPHKIILKHKDKLMQIEALFFGQAGLLDKDFIDEYPKKLQKEYLFLQKKYNLTPLKSQQWKFMRMRPANFPTIRIAQFSVLLYRATHLLSKMLAVQSLQEIVHMFGSEVSGYWKSHYIFDKATVYKSRKLGKKSIHLILINTVVPFLFLYGKHHHQAGLQDKALKLLSETPPESNQIIKKFSDLGFTAQSAFDTQALLQLKKHYCDQKKCLQCAIGNAILKTA